MKNKKQMIMVAIAVGILLVFFSSIVAVVSQKQHNGASVESRELLLDEGIVTGGDHWTIAKEEKIGKYIVSGAYSTGGESTIAIFEPTRMGCYRFVISTDRKKDEIITDSLSLGDTRRDLVWFCGAKTDHAVIRYIWPDGTEETKRFDTTGMDIIQIENNEKEYTLEAKYYDADGNVYE